MELSRKNNDLKEVIFQRSAKKYSGNSANFVAISGALKQCSAAMSDRQLKRDRRSPLDTEVLQYQDLRELSGKTQLASVEAWARSQGIRYKRDGKGGIWTTVTALNVALGLSGDSTEEPLDLF